MHMTQLFDPITLRGLEVSNRIWVSPMCQYSAHDGIVGDWHLAHIGAMATGGAGLIIAEATAIVPEGRISVGCPGLYNNDQVQAWKRVVDFAHSQGTKLSIQLAHAGRKGATALPWSGHHMATIEEGGWQCVAPSAIAYEGYPVPRELSIAEIHDLVQAWGSAAKNAVLAGFDAVEIHAAHGYLLHEFYSPLSNTRRDEYGGSYENRVRFLKEVTAQVRAAIPATMPLFVRISASDWTEGGWSVDESVRLASELKELGVDLLDVSSGGNVHGAAITVEPGYQVQFAEAVKAGSTIVTSTVGMITDAHQANEIIESSKADVIMMARQFLRNPRWPLQAAAELGVEITWPHQLERGKIAKK
jgi:2,4-dienoyl-CoA reductase-like NADH-dependent reductase (Old Yellow Enzyme family)